MQANINNSKIPTRHVNAEKGFTLLELLVVVVIVAILFTYTTLAIRSDSAEDIIKKEAQRMERLVQLALEESILRGEEYGLEIYLDGYRFLRRPEAQWEPISNDKILRERELPNDMEIEFRLEETDIELGKASAVKKYMAEESALSASLADTTLGDDENDSELDAENKTKPQIFLMSSGEITPEFEIRFYIIGVETSYLVKGLFDGSLKTEMSDL